MKVALWWKNKNALLKSSFAGDKQVEDADMIGQVACVNDVEFDVRRETELTEMKRVTRPQRH